MSCVHLSTVQKYGSFVEPHLLWILMGFAGPYTSIMSSVWVGNAFVITFAYLYVRVWYEYDVVLLITFIYVYLRVWCEYDVVLVITFTYVYLHRLPFIYVY
jgi:hypothetical protein